MPGLVRGKQHSAAWLILPYPSDRAHGRICVCPSPPPPYNQSTHEKIALKVETEHGRTWTYLDRLAGRGCFFREVLLRAEDFRPKAA